MPGFNVVLKRCHRKCQNVERFCWLHKGRRNRESAPLVFLEFIKNPATTQLFRDLNIYFQIHNSDKTQSTQFSQRNGLV